MCCEKPKYISFVSSLLGAIVLKAELKSTKSSLAKLPYCSMCVSVVWRTEAWALRIQLK